MRNNGAMSSPGAPQPGGVNPYSREAAPGQGLGEQPELDPQEAAAAAAWASTLNSDTYQAPYGTQQDYANPYDAYAADPYGTTQAHDPYSAASYADPYSPYAGQHPGANPYATTNPYAVVPAQGYGLYTPYGKPLVNHPNAVPALVVSLISYVFCPLLGAVGLFMGISALNGVNREPDRYTGKGMAISGIVLGGLATIGTLFFLMFFIFGIASY